MQTPSYGIIQAYKKHNRKTLCKRGRIMKYHSIGFHYSLETKLDEQKSLYVNYGFYDAIGTPYSMSFFILWEFIKRKKTTKRKKVRFFAWRTYIIVIYLM